MNFLYKFYSDKKNDFKGVIDDEKNFLVFYFSELDNIDYIINELSKFNFIGIRIYLEYLNLETIPKNIFNLKNIVDLLLKGNRLKTIPPEITKLTKLKILSIGHNNFEDFPTSVCDCINLKYLNISNCKLTTIPLCITKLINIVTLVVFDNKFDLLPKSICKLHSLQYLNDCYYNNGDNELKIPYSIHDIQNFKGNIYQKNMNKKLIYRLYALLIKNYLKLNFKIINKLIKY